jgi:hypothetical protein
MSDFFLRYCEPRVFAKLVGVFACFFLFSACVHDPTKQGKKINKQESSALPIPSINELRSSFCEQDSDCSPVQEPAKKKSGQRADLWQQEAKHGDLPSPLQAESFTVPLEQQSNDTTVIGYQTTLEQPRLLAMCRQDMNALGWQEVAVFYGVAQVMLVFTKPQHVCVAIVKACKKKDHREIIYYMKTGSKLQSV